MTIKKIKKEILQWACPLCGKTFENMNESQLEYWIAVHMYKCKRDHNKEVKENEN